MILNRFKKPFVVLCILLASSAYVSAIPIDIDATSSIATQVKQVELHSSKMNIVGGHVNRDDSDIKEIREEERPVRDARSLKFAKPL